MDPACQPEGNVGSTWVKPRFTCHSRAGLYGLRVGSEPCYRRVERGEAIWGGSEVDGTGGFFGALTVTGSCACG